MTGRYRETGVVAKYSDITYAISHDTIDELMTSFRDPDTGQLCPVVCIDPRRVETAATATEIAALGGYTLLGRARAAEQIRFGGKTASAVVESGISGFGGAKNFRFTAGDAYIKTLDFFAFPSSFTLFFVMQWSTFKTTATAAGIMMIRSYASNALKFLIETQANGSLAAGGTSSGAYAGVLPTAQTPGNNTSFVVAVRYSAATKRFRLWVNTPSNYDDSSDDYVFTPEETDTISFGDRPESSVDALIGRYGKVYVVGAALTDLDVAKGLARIKEVCGITS